jgi:SAM-dependent methyltransferase
VIDEHYCDPRLTGLYDALCAGRPDFAFYLPLVVSAGSVLDVGCGTGELLHLARAAGHAGRLHGLDPAAAMLDHARECRTVEWTLGTLASLLSATRFELVVMTGHAFQVLLTDEAIAETLVCVQSLLDDRGRFAFETRATHPSRRKARRVAESAARPTENQTARGLHRSSGHDHVLDILNLVRGGAPYLAHSLRNSAHPMHICLTELSSVRIDRKCSADVGSSVSDEPRALPGGAEAERF